MAVGVTLIIGMLQGELPPMFTRMDSVKMLSVGSRKGVYNIGSGDW